MCRWDFMVQPGVGVDVMCADFDAFCNQRSALYAKVGAADARPPRFTRFTRRL